VTFYRFVRAVVLSVFKVVFRVRVVSRGHVPPSGVYIVAPSHRSILDVPFAAFTSKRRIRFMAKDELFTSRLGGWLFTKLGAIKVDREVTDRAALRASQQALEDGEPLAIFPEGTRRSGPAITDLFDGVAYLALKLGVPILPVGVGGTEKILPTGKVLPRIHKVVVVIGAPIPAPATGGVRKRSEVAALTATLQRELEQVFDEAMRRSGVATPEHSATEARQHV
jgi:1-acyl-sn-glycerol-3-phosphate acyltransferase